MIQDDRSTDIRKSDQIISRLVELWPIWALLAGGIAGGLKLKWAVDDLRSDVDSIIAKDLPEEHRLTIIEKDLDWLKELRRNK